MRITPVLRSLLGLASLIGVTTALLLVPATSASAAGEEGDFVNRLNACAPHAGWPHWRSTETSPPSLGPTPSGWASRTRCNTTPP